MVIDAHLQLGFDYIYTGRDTVVFDVLNAMELNGVAKSILYPANSNIGLDVEREAHQVVIDAMKSHPDKFVGVCNVNPHLGALAYHEEIERYMSKGFKAISVNPLINAWNPNGKDSTLPFEAARKHGVPLCIYATTGIPFAYPINFYYLIKRYSEVKVVLIHAGHHMYDSEFLALAKDLNNVYFETSFGPNMRMLKKFVKIMGPERIMMASEVLEEIPHSIYMYQNAGLTDSELDWCMAKSAMSVFRM